MSTSTLTPPLRCAYSSTLRHTAPATRSLSYCPSIRSTARRRIPTSYSASRRNISTSTSHDINHTRDPATGADQICRGGSITSTAKIRRTYLRPSQLAFTSTTRRRFSATPTARHGDLEEPKPGEGRRITILDKNSTPHTFLVADGTNLLDLAQAHDLDMEGACGGSCACSTCHVIITDTNYSARPSSPIPADSIGRDGVSGLEPAAAGDEGPQEAFYDRLPEPSDDENDMLDLAFGLTETSRLGCQIVAGRELDGLTVRLPGMTRNLQASDFDGGGGGGG